MELKTVLILTLVLIGYLCAGAALFMVMERQHEEDTKQGLRKEFAQFIGKEFKSYE